MSLGISSWTFSFQKTAFIDSNPIKLPLKAHMCVIWHFPRFSRSAARQQFRLGWGRTAWRRERQDYLLWYVGSACRAIRCTICAWWRAAAMIRWPAVMGRGIACGSFCVRWPPAAHLGGPAGALNRSSGYMKRLRRRAPRGRPAVPTQIKISLRGGPGFDRTLEVHAAHAHDHAYFVHRIAVCEPPRSCFWSRDHPPEPPRWSRRAGAAGTRVS